MLVRVYELKDAPDLPLYMFIWFTWKTVSWFCLNIKNLIVTIRFGRVLSNIGKMFNNLYKLPTIVKYHYNINYKRKYQDYIEHIRQDYTIFDL